MRKTGLSRRLILLTAGLGWVASGCGWAAAVAESGRARLELNWPTPNTAWIAGRTAADYLQATVSGDPASGGFGCVRDDGEKFHEGIDLKPVARDAAGEPTDKVFAMLAGVVRYINDRPEQSNYGRYVVLEHPDVTPAIYTLYAHLRMVAPGLVAGARLSPGAVLGVMGHTADGEAIPATRAHLHFEMGLRVTEDFQPWYGRQKFDSPNPHGVWNGLNLMGVDPLDFLEKFRARRVNNFADYFAQLRPAVKLRIATKSVPNFTQRYPSLLTHATVGAVSGWEIWFNATGLPFRFTPLVASEVVDLAPGVARIIETDDAGLAACPCRQLIVTTAGKKSPGKDLAVVLAQLFGG
jgi:hypothetical protein